MTNLQAFLATIAASEGTEPIGDHGYNVIVGSRVGREILMTHYRDHPRVKVQLSGTLWSTAAGRFQILERYFDAYRARLQLPDFSPLCQDAIALQMIREQGAYDDIAAGRFEVAVSKCAHLWASLAGSAYGQPTRSMAFLTNAYQAAGGTLA